MSSRKILLALVSLGLCATAFAIRNGTLTNDPVYSGVGQFLPTATHARATGVLVSRNVVLTAAQVFGDQTPKPNFQFELDPTHKARVMHFYQHPNFRTASYNYAFDLAVAVLDKSKTRDWTGIPLSTWRTTPVSDGSPAIAVGFGQSSNSVGDGSRRSGVLLVTSYTEGQGLFGEIIPHAFLQVVPGNAQNQMFCYGDFGGPVFVDGQIAGIASYTTSFTCDGNGPGYCVAVDRLSDWLQNALDELDPPGACNCNDNGSFATREGGCHDLVTGLVWSSQAANQSQPNALAYADALLEAGRNDWRLPTFAEARQLDRNNQGCERGVEVPTRIWTSLQIQSAYAVAWNFNTHNAEILPRTLHLGCMSVRVAQ